jgi:hypothetical protein
VRCCKNHAQKSTMLIIRSSSNSERKGLQRPSSIVTNQLVFLGGLTYAAILPIGSVLIFFNGLYSPWYGATLGALIFPLGALSRLVGGPSWMFLVLPFYLTLPNALGSFVLFHRKSCTLAKVMISITLFSALLLLGFLLFVAMLATPDQ